MKLSIVSTLYQSEKYIDEFYRRSKLAAESYAGESYEIIFVNDGSPDSSLNIAIEIAKIDKHVTVIDLSRNFGHHKAMMTGLAHSIGEQVFLIDSDLEEEPEWLATFSNAVKNSSDLDVVYGTQGSRKGGRTEKLSGYLFYRLFRALTGIDQPDNIVTARLMSRRYVDALLMHKERELNIGGIWVITGFKQLAIQVTKHNTSPTTYSLRKKISHLVNAVTSFSSLPLVFTFYSGLIISATAVAFILLLIIKFLSHSTIPSGYTSIIASIWLFSGLIISFLGIQGIYISKIFMEIKQRPYTIIKEIHNSGK
ncbi:glycosyltransferase family 2 protein [Pseudomonas sp. B21-054]|uniref:glycosyltransferase family 2 protein n=1 Tax=Pseudomonas sp. B21-054 TaxID=2895494 RepID=UPI0022323EC5|nr:glycosyltransferase family 2 protein [Pseudomonas sp. B21-054]UZE19618.1 glycosyltransferase family 2 protein [Pseudomonas sp. B21-054]